MGVTKPRVNPAMQAKMREHSKDEMMTRADSLRSVQQYGRIVTPSEQARLKAKPAKKPGLLGRIKTALTGGS